MGIDYENVDKFNYYEYENIIPFTFTSKKEQENKISPRHSQAIDSDSEYSKIKKPSTSEDISIQKDPSISHSRKSTFDEEDFKEDKYFLSQPKEDKISNIFKEQKNSPFFRNKKEILLKDDDKYFLAFNESEDIRKKYYSKLIYKNIWSPGYKPKTHNSLFIFDWDDTLLPTSYLIKTKLVDEENLSQELKYIFNILEELVTNILKLAIDKGDVYIITNSSKSWFNFTCDKYFPNLRDLLTKINIISARDEYETIYPGENQIWKKKAFLNLETKINSNLTTNIICFGDSSIEIEAGKIFASQLKNSFIKTVKFKEKPEPEELIKQLNLIVNQFNFIYSKAKNLTIKIEEKN